MNDRIVIDPKICHGKPVIRGTRLPVSIVVGSLAGGMTFEDVQREYGISGDDIRSGRHRRNRGNKLSSPALPIRSAERNRCRHL